MPTAARRSARPRRLRVVVTSPDDGRMPSRGLATWLERAAPGRARGDVTVALISDGRMRTLNRAFRGKDHATDVLSFPTVPSVGRRSSVVGNARSSTDRRPDRRLPTNDYRQPTDNSLGDIVIATGVARRQAKEAGHPMATELRVLALHGLLHLLGYDHERDDGQMKKTEARLRRAAGLEEGLMERGRTGT